MTPEQEMVGTGVIVAAVGLMVTIVGRIFGSGEKAGKMANRLYAMENILAGVQEEIKNIGQLLVNVADLRGDVKTLNVRMTNIESDMRELRHGEGIVSGVCPFAQQVAKDQK